MARRNRRFNVFSLSFLDCMSCGFGAVILFFMIINHETENRQDDFNADRMSEVNLLESEIKMGERNLTEMRNSLDQTRKDRIEAQGLSARVIDSLELSRTELDRLTNETISREEHINALLADIESKIEEKKRLEGERAANDERGEAVRKFIGAGHRQYLTGLRMGGERILVAVDASGSMLDETIVNIIRRRNMSDDRKRASRKWRRAVRTVEWLSSQFPSESSFQLYTFNTKPKPVIEGTENKWLEVEGGKKLTQALTELSKIIPEDGTNMFALFQEIADMNPRPDNVILITDGLPTLGLKPPRKGTITGRQRKRLFIEALEVLPSGIPFNIVLFPLEGDPKAAAEFWRLAQASNGSFISPARDWP